MKLYTDKCLCNRDWILDEIESENKRQLDKWGIQTHTSFEWCNYLTEELGELAKAIADFEYDRGEKIEVKKEAIQVATLALKIAEMFDKNISPLAEPIHARSNDMI